VRSASTHRPTLVIGTAILETQQYRLWTSSVITSDTICTYTSYKLKLKLIYDRQTVGQSVLVSGAHLGGTCDQFFFLLEISFRQLRL
jgi:hypothetical protein